MNRGYISLNDIVMRFKFGKDENIYIFSNFRIDVCDSKVEVTTPYWATNSKGKVRAIVNNKQFEQAVHQEICRYVYNIILKF